jgi:putative membrane protein
MNVHLSQKLRIISFISIILVVLIHSQFLAKETFVLNRAFQFFFSYGITTVAVPFFFSISGYLFFFNTHNIFREYFFKIKKRIKTVLIPYLIVSVYGSSLIILLLNIPFSKSFFNPENQIIFQGSILKIFYTIFNNPLVYQLWFLRDLMCLFILSPIIYLLVKYIKWLYIAILVVLWLEVFGFQIPFLDNKSILFFSLGAFIAINNQGILLKKYNNNLLYICVLGWLLFVIAETIINTYYSVGHISALMLLKINTLWGGYSVWVAYDLFFKNKEKLNNNLGKLSSYTFFIYLYHEPLLNIVKQGLLYFAGGDKVFLRLIVYFISPAIAVMLCVLVAQLLQKYILSIYKIITGGR